MWTKWLIWVVLFTYLGLTQFGGADDSVSCKSGWHQFSNKCYKLGGEAFGAGVTWDQAAAKCVSEGGQLVTIASKEVQEFLEKFLLLAEKSAWIGMKTNLSGYYWIDGSAVSYTNWAPNQDTRGSIRRECVEMLFRYGITYRFWGKWSIAFGCGSKLAYICMAETIPPTVTQQIDQVEHKSITQSGGADDSNICKSGWLQFSNKCYKLGGETFRGEVPRDQAAAKCVSEGGQLVTIGSKAVQEFLEKFLVLENERSVWIGMKTNFSAYYWDDGATVSYTNWMPNDDTITYKSCVVMVFRYRDKLRFLGKWTTTFECSSKFAYICMTETIPPTVTQQIDQVGHKGITQSGGADDSNICKSGWLQFREKCYKLGGKEESERLDRDRAAAKCISEGGNLATIGFQDVQKFLVKKFLLLEKKMSAWIGMKTNQSGYYWDDGSAVSYTNWKKDEVTRGNSAYCMVLNDDDNNPYYLGDWTTIYACSSKFAYICMAETSLTQYVGTLDSTFCKSGWTQFRDKCYTLKDKEVYVSRNRAAAECVHEDGNLVTIGSKEVQEFLVKFLLQDIKGIKVWIGLKRNNSGIYWDDGSTVKYTNLMSSNPIIVEDHPYEHCASMDFMYGDGISEPGAWTFSSSCRSGFAYICMAELSCPTYEVAFIISITLVVILVVILGSVIYYFRTKGATHRRTLSDLEI